MRTAEVNSGNAESVRFEADEDDDGSALPRNFSFDWVAYHVTFGDTPMEDAVTAMFAEYAVLYGRIAGWATSTSAAPVTLEEAKDIAGHAEDFVIKYVTPILGVVQTPKVHKLLRHVLDAIRMHGNLQNGNTGGNEAQHKEDKVFYRRTNKTIKSFTQQIVRQAQGSREVLKNLKTQDEDEERSARAAHVAAVAAKESEQLPAPGVAVLPSVDAAELDGAVGGSCPLPKLVDAANACASEPATPKGERRDRVRIFPRKSIAVLCQRPGLSRLGQLLGLPAVSTLKVLNGLRIAARLDCGTMLSQVLRATPAFMAKPWYDAVLIDGEDPSKADGAGEHEPAGMLVGELRLLFRRGEEDMAVVCMWEAVSAVPGCPLAARSCARLRWATSQDGEDFSVRVIPARRIRRVAHVVPDFAELARKAGMDALPPARAAAMSQQRDMRFFVNEFCPWA
eukprot:contig_4138_g905